MSRFSYRLHYKEKIIGDFTSINRMINVMCHVDYNGLGKMLLFSEVGEKIITAFKVPPFSKRKPQIFEDKKSGIKIESQYVVFTGTLPYPRKF